MPVTEVFAPTFVGPTSVAATSLAAALGAGIALRCPTAPADQGWRWTWDDTLARWREEIAAVPATDALVVCAWPDLAPVAPLTDLDPVTWRAQVEWPTALWFTTLVAAAGRCRDAGSVVAVIERPVTLDAPGHAPVVAVGDGLVNLVRSLAAIEGRRGVRVNAVTTEVLTTPQQLLGAPPALPTFPGRIEVEVAGAVRALLAPDAVGVTGIALAADCGR